jgi:hypothetical protein
MWNLDLYFVSLHPHTHLWSKDTMCLFMFWFELFNLLRILTDTAGELTKIYYYSLLLHMGSCNVLCTRLCCLKKMYTLLNKNQVAWYFVCPAQAVTWGTVAIIIRVVLLSPYLWICGVSLSSFHYSQSRHVYINQRRLYICLIWS